MQEGLEVRETLKYNVTMTPATNGVKRHGSPDRGWALNDPSGNFQFLPFLCFNKEEMLICVALTISCSCFGFH